MLCSRKGGFFGNVVILVINAVKCTLCLSKWLSLCRSTMPVNDLLESNWMSKLDGCRRRLGRSGGRMKRRSASRLKGILGGRSVPSRAEHRVHARANLASRPVRQRRAHPRTRKVRDSGLAFPGVLPPVGRNLRRSTRPGARSVLRPDWPASASLHAPSVP